MNGLKNHRLSARWLTKADEDISQRLLGIFRKGQDYFVRLNWQDEVLFPHEAASNNICYLNQAVQALEEGEIEEALKALYEVDNNCYAFLFDEEVYYHFTEYILHQPKRQADVGSRKNFAS